MSVFPAQPVDLGPHGKALVALERSHITAGPNKAVVRQRHARHSSKAHFVRCTFSVWNMMQKKLEPKSEVQTQLFTNSLAD